MLEGSSFIFSEPFPSLEKIVAEAGQMGGLPLCVQLPSPEESSAAAEFRQYAQAEWAALSDAEKARLTQEINTATRKRNPSAQLADPVVDPAQSIDGAFPDQSSYALTFAAFPGAEVDMVLYPQDRQIFLSYFSDAPVLYLLLQRVMRQLGGQARVSQADSAGVEFDFPLSLPLTESAVADYVGRYKRDLSKTARWFGLRLGLLLLAALSSIAALIWIIFG